MSTKVPPIGAVSSLSSSQALIQRPTFSVGAPFNRDEVSSLPIRITVNKETCDFEAVFPVVDRSIDVLQTQVMARSLNEIIEGVYCITRFAPNRVDDGWHFCSSQVIYCIPYGYQGRQIPENFADFKELVLNAMEAMQRGAKKEAELSVQEIDVPNRKYFALRMHLEPSVTVVEHPKETVMVDGQEMTESRIETVEKGGFLMHAYATSNALYLLHNQVGGGQRAILNANQMKTFVSSFMLTE